MSGRDLIGIAKTGSGKTIAFLLPMFRHIMDQRPLEEAEGPICKEKMHLCAFKTHLTHLQNSSIQWFINNICKSKNCTFINIFYYCEAICLHKIFFWKIAEWEKNCTFKAFLAPSQYPHVLHKGAHSPIHTSHAALSSPAAAVIMTPTRELALQITKECKKFSKPLGLRVVCVYGGTGISEQVNTTNWPTGSAQGRPWIIKMSKKEI